VIESDCPLVKCATSVNRAVQSGVHITLTTFFASFAHLAAATGITSALFGVLPYVFPAQVRPQTVDFCTVVPNEKQQIFR
jgi:hypothetical protein